MAFQNWVPRLDRNPWGIVGLILNWVPFPGVGSIIAGAKASDNRTIVIGILQMLLAFAYGIGWIWSMVWGILIYARSE